MKIKLSKSQWEGIGKKAGWVKTAKIGKDDVALILDRVKEIFAIMDRLKGIYLFAPERKKLMEFQLGMEKVLPYAEAKSKGGWLKTSQNVRWFNWDDNNGIRWNIAYRDIEPSEMYENGKALSDKAIMEKMIVSIQNDASDEKLPDRVFKYWIDKAGLSTAEFFEEVQQANNLFRDEQRIEQRDIDTGLV